MSAGSVTLITYVWHYLFARTIYEQLLRPLLHGHVPSLLLLGCLATGAFLLGRWTGRRGTRRASGRGMFGRRA
jgi:hypothetical protein